VPIDVSLVGGGGHEPQLCRQLTQSVHIDHRGNLVIVNPPSLRRDAVIDKLIGDEVMAFFVRGISGPDYRHQAVRAGLELLSAVGYGVDSGPWLDVGAAVNAGPAYVGNVGGAVVDFTALGDTVNAAARMQQAAAGGELLVAAGVADDLVAHGSRRQLALRGRDRPIEAFVLTT
jgi:adenylate cyclase